MGRTSKKKRKTNPGTLTESSPPKITAISDTLTEGSSSQMAEIPDPLTEDSVPEKAEETGCEACHPCTLHPSAEERRKMVVESMKAKLKKQVQKDFEELQERYKTTGSRERAFLQWGKRHVMQQYPGLGETTAYSVPYCFIGRQDIKNMSRTGMFRHNQESQIRGDVALSTVGLALGLLNNKREKEAQEPNAQTVTHPFIILGAIFNEHILRWPEKLHTIYPEVTALSPDMAKQADKDFTPYCVSTGDKNTRGDIDLMVLDRQAHVVILEVKAYGLYKGSNTKQKKKNRWQEAYDQLQKALDNFKSMFPEKEFQDIRIRRVIAMPNILLKDAQTEFPEINIEHLEKEEMVYMLTQDDMIKKEFEKSEADFDISKLENWWNAKFLTNLNPELSLDLMQTIVARYIGTLSRPVGMSLNQQRNQLRTPCDAIELSASVFKSLCYFFTENEELAVEEVEELLKCPPEEENKKMHIKGPPGSGRTTLTIVKATNFLKRASEDWQHHAQLTHVIIVDIYRGGRGRPVGLHVFNSIIKKLKNKNKDQFYKRVHYLPLDANTNISEEHFAEKVTDIIGKNKIETENLMFILDEILPIRFWNDILQALDKDIYRKSLVWCTDGLTPEDLGNHQKRFHTVHLRCITRIPPTVQKVMYHVDWWCENKLQRYRPDEYDVKMQQSGTREAAQSTKKETMVKTSVCWSTRGPIPLSIRHQRHGTLDSPHTTSGTEHRRPQQQNPGLNILNCPHCAEELAHLLKDKLGLIDESTASDPGKEILPCGIAILFSIPSNNYTDTQDDHVEITKGKCENYAAVIQNCPFMECLKSQFAPYIEVFTKVEEDDDKKDVEKEAFWNKILVCWVDKFQGLVKDVVIYLPSEICSSLEALGGSNTETEYKKSDTAKRKLPWPGTAMDENKAECMKSQPESITERMKNKPESTTASTTGQVTQASPGEKEEDHSDSKTQPATITAESAQGRQTDAPEKHEGAVDRRLAHMYWSTEDIDRYTGWDQTNLMFAASRCTSQLILIVP